jgi:transcriptional regulator with XRE-family HTH domain
VSDQGQSDHALGEHLSRRLRSLRNARGWSLARLGQLSGVSRSMLSEIERNEANPTVAVALAIARALGVSLNELVGYPEGDDLLRVIRHDDEQYVYRSDHQCRIRTLSPLSPERELEFYEIQLNIGGELRSAPHFVGTREFLTVGHGRVRVEVHDRNATLGAGDSIAYPADVPHAIVNVGEDEALVFLIDTCPGS